MLGSGSSALEMELSAVPGPCEEEKMFFVINPCCYEYLNVPFIIVPGTMLAAVYKCFVCISKSERAVGYSTCLQGRA